MKNYEHEALVRIIDNLSRTVERLTTQVDEAKDDHLEALEEVATLKDDLAAANKRIAELTSPPITITATSTPDTLPYIPHPYVPQMPYQPPPSTPPYGPTFVPWCTSEGRGLES